MDQNELKKAVAEEAARIVFSDLDEPIQLGVGTGSTVNCFIDLLAKYRAKILSAVSSSVQSSELLQALNVEVVEASSVSSVDVYVDGADEVDPSFALIKGGGGAHTQEKIVTSITKEFICIVDESKVVSQLGEFPIPVEVIHSALRSVERQIEGLGGGAKLRKGFTSDNGHAILDIHGLRVENPDHLESEINNLPGVVEVGIFAAHRPHRVVVGSTNGVYELEK